MRTNNLFRSVLALGAVLAVAGPGLVLAGETSYTPRALQVLGPSSVPINSEAQFSAKVFFTNGTSQTFTSDANLVWDRNRGSITQSGIYTAPANTGRDAVRATYSNNGVTVVGAKIIQNPQ